MFGRRRWRTPWSRTSGTSGAVSTPTVKVIPPGVTASAGRGTAPGGVGAPGATPSSGRGGLPGSGGSPESADPPGTRVIRIPASVGVEHPGDSASASSRSGADAAAPPVGVGRARGAVGGCASLGAGWVGRARTDRAGRDRRRDCLCAARRARRLRRDAWRDHRQSASGGVDRAGGHDGPRRAPGTGVSRAGSKHMGGQGHSGHGSAAPLPPRPAASSGATATPASSGGGCRCCVAVSQQQAPSSSCSRGTRRTCRQEQPRSGCSGRWAGRPCGRGGSTAS